MSIEFPQNTVCFFYSSHTMSNISLSIWGVLYQAFEVHVAVRRLLANLAAFFIFFQALGATKVWEIYHNCPSNPSKFT